MNTLIALFAFAFTIQASAANNSEQIKSVLEAQPYCQNFVRVDSQNIYLGFGPYRRGFEEPREKIPAFFRVAPIDGSTPFEMRTNDSTIDIVTMGKTAYVLTHTSIEEWDLEKRQRIAEYDTYKSMESLESKQHAEAMALYKNKLVIAHGRLGVSFFDLTTKKISNQFLLVQKQLPLESVATGITIQGNLAYILLDSYSLANPGEPNKTFRGIVVVNLETETVVAELGGMDPGADSLTSDNKKVIVSFMGNPIWKYAKDSLKGSRLVEPEVRIWKFPIMGHPSGAAQMDDKYYYTCFSRHPDPNEGGGYSTLVPMALDRRVLRLD